MAESTRPVTSASAASDTFLRLGGGLAGDGLEAVGERGDELLAGGAGLAGDRPARLHGGVEERLVRLGTAPKAAA